MMSCESLTSPPERNPRSLAEACDLKVLKPPFDIAPAEIYACSHKSNDLESRRKGGYAALNVMENHLRDRDFFVAGTCTIADLSLYTYTHCAAEGGFQLADFARVGAWLKRVAGHPRHVTMAQFA